MKSILTIIVFTFTFHLSYAQVDFDTGKQFIESAEYDSAQFYFQSLLDSCANNCNDSTIAYLHVYLGKSLKLLNKYDIALQSYIKGVELFQKIKNQNGVAFGLISLAEFYRSLIQFDKSTTYLDLAEDIHKTDKLSNANLAYLYNRRAAVISESTGINQQVIDYSIKVIEIAKKMGDRDLEANSLNELGYTYEQERNEIAIDHYLEAYKIYKDLNNPRYTASVLNNIARALYKFDKYEESLTFSAEGIKMSEGKAWTKIVPELYHCLYLNYIKLNQTNKALAAYINYHENYIQARELEWNKSLYQIEARYELKEKEKQLVEIKLNEAIAKKDSQQKIKQRNYLLVVGLLLLIAIGALYWAYQKIKRTNSLLNYSIAQKEILMQEVHHRVKNNLTLLKSLLYLRAKATVDEDVKMILDECQARIHAIALVHQNLYDVEDATRVDFNIFLKDLFFELERIFDEDQREISVHINVHESMIDMRMSVFLGLIINELITNTYKYAFVNCKTGKIQVQLKKAGEMLELIYSDSGSGLPNGFDDEASTGFGFKLINILLSQINAKLVYTNNKMSTFTILIPK